MKAYTIVNTDVRDGIILSDGALRIGSEIVKDVEINEFSSTRICSLRGSAFPGRNCPICGHKMTPSDGADLLSHNLFFTIEEGLTLATELTLPKVPTPEGAIVVAFYERNDYYIDPKMPFVKEKRGDKGGLNVHEQKKIFPPHVQVVKESLIFEDTESMYDEIQVRRYGPDCNRCLPYDLAFVGQSALLVFDKSFLKEIFPGIGIFSSLPESLLS